MGQRLSRGYYTPLKDVTVRQLAAGSGGGSHFLLSPAFCLKVLKRGLPPHYECSKKDLAQFRRGEIQIHSIEKIWIDFQLEIWLSFCLRFSQIHTLR